MGGKAGSPIGLAVLFRGEMSFVFNIRGGAGDTLAALWLAEALEAAGVDWTMHTGYQDAAWPFFGRRVREWAAGPGIFPLWEDIGADLRSQAETPRIAQWMARLPEDLRGLTPRRPMLRNDLPAPKWPGEILFFPDAVWGRRRWTGAQCQRLLQLAALDGVRLRVIAPGDRWAPLKPERCEGWLGILSEIRAAAGVICMDSGPLHAAAALGTPTVALMAMHSPESTLPALSAGTAWQFAAVTPDWASPCSPCYQDPARGFVDEPTHCRGQCFELQAIPASRVWNAAKSVFGPLQNRPKPAAEPPKPRSCCPAGVC